MSEKPKENPNENSIIEKSIEKIIKYDNIYFKEEILENIKEIKKEFIKQNKEIKRIIDEKNFLYDQELNNINNKINEAIKSFDSNTYLQDRVKELLRFKKDITDITTSNQIKINFLVKDTTDSITRINKILESSVVYPRVIGANSKYKTFHEYIDYTLVQLSTMDNFRKRMEYDLQFFKIKIDKIMQTLQVKMDTSINTAHQLVKNGIKENENILKEFVNSRIFDMQIKNNELELRLEKNNKEIKKQMNNLNNKIKEDIIKINNVSKELNKNLEEFKCESSELKNKISDFFQFQENNQNIQDVNKNKVIENDKNIIEEEKKKRY